MLRLGLCCLFVREPIRFRTVTAARLQPMLSARRLEWLSQLALDNAAALEQALHYCAAHGIGDFRINSQFFPLKTHPQLGYELVQLPDWPCLREHLGRCREYAAMHDLRLTFHPDQFVLLNSPRTEVMSASLRELAAQNELAELVGADVINLHGGGGYGDKPAALRRLENAIRDLPSALRQRLTLENDDRIFTPSDLLPVCRSTGIPLVYDVHHHRCLSDGMTEREATVAALTTWNREPLFHLSSPRDGWKSRNSRWHHDYIHWADFPDDWRHLPITIEVEAKAKELAVLRLAKKISRLK